MLQTGVFLGLLAMGMDVSMPPPRFGPDGQPVRALLGWMPGEAQCGGAQVGHVMLRRPLGELSFGVPAKAPSISYTFEIDAAGRPLSIARDNGASTGFSGALGGAGGAVITHTDISERRQTEESLRIAATAFESQQGMVITDAQRRILRVNQAFTQITGYSAEEAIGQGPHILASGRHDAEFYDRMAQALEAGGIWIGEIWNRRKNGEVYPEWLSISAVKSPQGSTTHYVGIFSDISEQIRAKAQIDHLSFYDQLTQLPNRRLLLDRLDQALHTSTRHARKNALLFVDLDNFKMLNDTLGHQQGDRLLVQVAQRLRSCTRDGDTVARLGSDEFVVMLENLAEDEMEAATQAESVGNHIIGSFEADFELEQVHHHTTPSIGITLFGGASVAEGEEPLKQAELAMFQAKAAGRNTLRFFEAQMQAEVSARAALEADLRTALAQQQLLLHYQPQVVGAGRITGVEVLVRWQHPQRGMVPPVQFILKTAVTQLPRSEFVAPKAAAVV